MLMFGFGVFLAVVADQRHAHKHRGQQVENVSLDQTEENLEKVKARWQDDREQRPQDRQQQGPGEDIAKQPEAERDDLDELQEQLQETDGKIDQAEDPSTHQRPELEELAEIE